MKVAELFEGVAGPLVKFKKGQIVTVKKTGEKVEVMSQSDSGLVFTASKDAVKVPNDKKIKIVPGKGYKEYMPRELQEGVALDEQIRIVFENRGQLDEGIWDVLKTGFNQIAGVVSKVAKSNNTKSSLNDVTLGGMYQDELQKLKASVDKLPDQAQQALWKLLAKGGVKPSGVDISRNNLNRLVLVKIMRLVVFTMTQMRDNGIEWILSSVVSGGLGMIVSALMGAKDLKSISLEVSASASQLKTLYSKAKV